MNDQETWKISRERAEFWRMKFFLFYFELIYHNIYVRENKNTQQTQFISIWQNKTRKNLFYNNNKKLMLEIFESLNRDWLGFH